MMIFGSECTHVLSESPYLFCGAPARWAHVDRGRKQVLNVLCDAHRVAPSVLIEPDAPRAAPSPYMEKRWSAELGDELRV